MARRTARHDLGTARLPGERGARHGQYGPNALGPYPAADGLRIPDVSAATIARAVPWLDGEGVEEIRGRVNAFNGRCRAMLICLLEGGSNLQAAARGGVTVQTVDRWRRDPAFDDAWLLCYSLGSSLYESELLNRALAGPDDKGSMRALELVVKARNADYRDKAQVQMGVVHVMGNVIRDAAGWRVNATDKGALPSGD